MAKTLQDLVADVQSLKTVDDSVVALLNGLSQQLKDAIAANDPAAIQAVADAIEGETARLATAVAANTPGAPLGPNDVPPLPNPAPQS